MIPESVSERRAGKARTKAIQWERPEWEKHYYSWSPTARDPQINQTYPFPRGNELQTSRSGCEHVMQKLWWLTTAELFSRLQFLLKPLPLLPLCGLAGSSTGRGLVLPKCSFMFFRVQQQAIAEKRKCHWLLDDQHQKYGFHKGSWMLWTITDVSASLGKSAASPFAPSSI